MIIEEVIIRKTEEHKNSMYVSKVSLLGVDSLWGDCTFIPAD